MPPKKKGMAQVKKKPQSDKFRYISDSDGEFHSPHPPNRGNSPRNAPQQSRMNPTNASSRNLTNRDLERRCRQASEVEQGTSSPSRNARLERSLFDDFNDQLHLKDCNPLEQAVLTASHSHAEASAWVADQANTPKLNPKIRLQDQDVETEEVAYPDPRPSPRAAALQVPLTPASRPLPHSHSEEKVEAIDDMSGGAYIASGQQRHMRACMVCAVVRTENQFKQQGCPNCEAFLELAGNTDAVHDCTSQVFDGLCTVSDTGKSWVARWQRLDGYVPGVYAIQVEGILGEDYVAAAEAAGVHYIPRDGSVNEALPQET